MPKKKILFMDDDNAMRGFVSLSLEHDYEVKTAASPEQAFELAAQEHFDLAIFDYHVANSELDGLYIALQFGKTYPKTPCGILTVYGKEELNDTSIQAIKTSDNIKFYEQKPISPKNLTLVVSNALLGRRSINI